MEISPSIQEIEIPLVNIIYKKNGFYHRVYHYNLQFLWEAFQIRCCINGFLGCKKVFQET